MKLIIDTLKNNKIYDETFIIFKSDHGKPLSYYKENNINRKEINNNIRWSLGRYNSFLISVASSMYTLLTIFPSGPV